MKTFLIILAIVGGLALVFFIVISILMRLPGKIYDCPREVLAAQGGDAPKALVVYQPSLSKASDQVAHAIAEGLNDSGYVVTLECPSPGLSMDISAYSILVFGSPVYGGQPATTLTDYMQRIPDFSQARVILFATGGAAAVGPEFDKMKEILGTSRAFAIIKYAASQKEAIQAGAYQVGVDAAGEK
jgi:flavodoxin